MRRREYWYLAAFILLASLLLANLLQPVQLAAFTLPDGSEAAAVSVSAVGDGESAWVVVNNKVYYVSLKPRSELKNRTISVIDDEKLN